MTNIHNIVEELELELQQIGEDLHAIEGLRKHHLKAKVYADGDSIHAGIRIDDTAMLQSVLGQREHDLKSRAEVIERVLSQIAEAIKTEGVPG